MDFLKRLYERLAPWYDADKHAQKEKAAKESIAEVQRTAREASRVIASYRLADKRYRRVHYVQR